MLKDATGGVLDEPYRFYETMGIINYGFGYDGMRVATGCGSSAVMEANIKDILKDPAMYHVKSHTFKDPACLIAVDAKKAVGFRQVYSATLRRSLNKDGYREQLRSLFDVNLSPLLMREGT